MCDHDKAPDDKQAADAGNNDTPPSTAINHNAGNGQNLKDEPNEGKAPEISHPIETPKKSWVDNISKYGIAVSIIGMFTGGISAWSAWRSSEAAKASSQTAESALRLSAEPHLDMFLPPFLPFNPDPSDSTIAPIVITNTGHSDATVHEIRIHFEAANQEENDPKILGYPPVADVMEEEIDEKESTKTKEWIRIYNLEKNDFLDKSYLFLVTYALYVDGNGKYYSRYKCNAYRRGNLGYYKYKMCFHYNSTKEVDKKNIK
ncbi:hypothetical protein JK210_00765 [Acetobacter persici]|nr:hypothetical protein [Acetobacter persici]